MDELNALSAASAQKRGQQPIITCCSAGRTRCLLAGKALHFANAFIDEFV